MPRQNIIRQISSLPPEAQEQVIQFVAFLHQRYLGSPGPRPAKRVGLSKEGFVGMWQGREDLRDSTTWVRGIRTSQWVKRNG
jgi:hypothetical protein